MGVDHDFWGSEVNAPARLALSLSLSLTRLQTGEDWSGTCENEATKSAKAKEEEERTKEIKSGHVSLALVVLSRSSWVNDANAEIHDLPRRVSAGRLRVRGAVGRKRKAAAATTSSSYERGEKEERVCCLK